MMMMMVMMVMLMKMMMATMVMGLSLCARYHLNRLTISPNRCVGVRHLDPVVEVLVDDGDVLEERASAQHRRAR
jgi:hypothetical protein